MSGRWNIYLKHFNLVSLQDALKQINNPLNNGYDKPSVVVTFDDGYAGNYRVLLPIVKSMNMPVTVFVATKHIQDQSLYWYDRLINALQGEENISLNHLLLGKYRINQCKGAENWREIERLLSDLKALEPAKREDVVEDIIKGINIQQRKKYNGAAPLSVKELQELAGCSFETIGAHSHCHNILTQLSEDKVMESIKTSKQLLESWINKPVNYFSYPNGNYNDNVINILGKIGFECSLTTVPMLWERVESLLQYRE